MSAKTNPPVYVVVAELFFRSKIRAVAEAAGVTAQFVRSFAEWRTTRSLNGAPALIVIDLTDRSLGALESLSALAQAGHRLLGFVSHVDFTTANAAREAGCAVLP